MTDSKGRGREWSRLRNLGSLGATGSSAPNGKVISWGGASAAAFRYLRRLLPLVVVPALDDAQTPKAGRPWPSSVLLRPLIFG
jgi:hypothetical protein